MSRPKENEMLSEVLAGLAGMRQDHPKSPVISAGPTGNFIKAHFLNLLEEQEEFSSNSFID